MNKEEIPVFRWNTETKEFYVLEHKFDGVNSIEDFINYIHNLDKENKQLKENNVSMQEEMVRTWEKADLYKEVIEEVRECIEELYDNTDDTTCYDIDRHRKEFLLQILDKAKEN